jgi:hypothetical protein
MQPNPEPLAVSILLIDASKNRHTYRAESQYVSVSHEGWGGSSLKEVSYDLSTCDHS